MFRLSPTDLQVYFIIFDKKRKGNYIKILKNFFLISFKQKMFEIHNFHKNAMVL